MSIITTDMALIARICQSNNDGKNNFVSADKKPMILSRIGIPFIDSIARRSMPEVRFSNILGPTS